MLIASRLQYDGLDLVFRTIDILCIAVTQVVRGDGLLRVSFLLSPRIALKKGEVTGL